jgi:hypothetical protein
MITRKQVMMKSVMNYMTTFRIISLMPVQVMSRSLGGEESRSFYGGRAERVVTTNAPNQLVPMQR